MLIQIRSLAQRCQKDVQVSLVNLNDARVERAMPCPRVAALLGVEELEAEFAKRGGVSSAHEWKRQRRGE